ncbi:MAG TPA: HEAT repeat domain-containing protein [Planctomycetes bacterium]|nr:HEAT repeat domain-containing protein [Planctomycetota bacterium]
MRPPFPFRFPLLLALLPSGRWTAPHLPHQDRVAQLVAQLGESKDSSRSYQAFQKLFKQKPKAALPLLVRALPGFSLYARSLAFSLIGSYPWDQAEPTLRKLLHCGAPAVELEAALVLRRQGDKSLGPRIAEILEHAPTSKERRAMLLRLGSLADPAIQAAVRDLLSPKLSSIDWDAALYYLLLSQDPKAPRLVQKQLADPTLAKDSRSLLQAFLLGAGQSTEDTAALVRDLESNGNFYRLQKFLLRAETLPPPVLEAALAFLRSHPDNYQARYAIALLARHKHQKALPLIRKLVASRQPLVSQAAFDALQKLGGLSGRASFYQFLKSSDPSLVLRAADTLRRRDDLSGLPKVLELVQSKSPAAKRLRYKALQVLGEFRSPRAVPLLIQALDDPDPSNRSQASWALAKTLRCIFPYRRIDLASAGYRPGATAGERADAVARIRAWWARVRPAK